MTPRADRTLAGAVLALFTLPALSAGPVRGQAEAEPRPHEEAARTPPTSADWDSPPTLDIVRRAIEARRHAYADSSLEAFRADVEGHVYFIGRFRGEDEVIRADQVALDVRWQAPDRAFQTIVGRRHEVRLPTDIRYHIDHLSLVLDNFGDRIRLGDGDEVWNVLHPAAEGALDVYEYRLADSLEIRLRDRAARVFEVEVRPRDPERPGVVGSLFVDRASGAIARMRITFTRASYRDPELDRIVLDLRSGLWEGRYWLPAEQDLEITRSLSWFDFPVETVIRTRLEVLEYRLGEGPGFTLAPGERVASLPTPSLAAYDGWHRSLWEGPLAEGERSDEELQRAVRGAGRLVRQRALAGDGPLQLSLPDASSGLRARRAEGLLVGAGGAARLDDRTRLSLWGGYASGTERPAARLALEREAGPWRAGLEARLRALEDVGTRAASGVLQTLALAMEGEDYTDPFFEDGARLSLGREWSGARLDAGISVRRQRSAALAMEAIWFGSGPLRPIRPIDEGELVALDARLALPLGRALGAAWEASAAGEAATAAIGSFGFSRLTLGLRAERDRLGSPWGWSSEVLIGFGGGDLPTQRLFLLGGRGTLPGTPFRPWAGDRVALWRGEVSRRVWDPWVRVRLLGAAGATELTGVGAPAAARFGAVETPGARAAAGLGLGLFYDLLRIDLVHALDRGTGAEGDGAWTLLISVDPMLHGVF